jgi:hypothetical protein
MIYCILRDFSDSVNHKRSGVMFMFEDMNYKETIAMPKFIAKDFLNI